VSAVVVDETDLLVACAGDVTLGDLEAAAARDGLTLGLDSDAPDDGTTVAGWLAAGAPGAVCALADPADHLVAGFEAVLRDGRVLLVRPEPRRAVGPDLGALVLGAEERFACVTRAWIRVHRRSAARPALPMPDLDLEPPVSQAEAALLGAIDDALRTR
jgi:alkyldihydroxyacetonephosphate synthase